MYVFECLGVINHINYYLLFCLYHIINYYVYVTLKCKRNSAFYAYVSGRALVARNNNDLILFDGNLPA